MTSLGEQAAVTPECAPFAPPLRLGFGCAGAWGMPWFPESDARRLIETALSSGVAHFDTGAFYARGEAERRLGAALRAVNRAGSVFVSTKTGTHIGRLGERRKDFSEEAIRADVERSLSRLGRTRLDLLYLHGPSHAQLDRAAPVMDALKQEGMIRFWGVCGEGANLSRVVERGMGDAVMGVFNVLNQRHADVFRAAKAAGMHVAAIAPLAQGLYRSDFFRMRTAADVWHVARALVKNRAELARARSARVRSLLEAPDWRPAELALRFALSQPFVDVAIAATTKDVHLAQLRGAAQRELSPALLRQARLIGAGA